MFVAAVKYFSWFYDWGKTPSSCTNKIMAITQIEIGI